MCSNDRDPSWRLVEGIFLAAFGKLCFCLEVRDIWSRYFAQGARSTKVSTTRWPPCRRPEHEGHGAFFFSLKGHPLRSGPRNWSPEILLWLSGKDCTTMWFVGSLVCEDNYGFIITGYICIHQRVKGSVSEGWASKVRNTQWNTEKYRQTPASEAVQWEYMVKQWSSCSDGLQLMVDVWFVHYPCTRGSFVLLLCDCEACELCNDVCEKWRNWHHQKYKHAAGDG